VEHAYTNIADLTVVIPAYGCANSITEVLRSLNQQTIKPREIIVVNDCSPDKLADILLNFTAQITIITNATNKGLAASYNIGLNAAKGKYLMTLHSDCVLPPDYINKLLKIMEANPHAGGISGTYRATGIKHFTFPNRVFSIINLLPLTEAEEAQLREISFLEGKADIYRRAAIEPLGFFSERYTLTCEDQDLSIRLRQKGWTLLECPSSTFTAHYSSTQDSIAKVLRKQRTYSRGQACIFLTHGKAALQNSTKNRNYRAWHRLSQIAFTGIFTAMFASSALFSSWLLLTGVLALTALRLSYYFVLANQEELPARLFVALLGVVGDFWYTIGFLEGFISFLFGSKKI